MVKGQQARKNTNLRPEPRNTTHKPRHYTLDTWRPGRRAAADQVAENDTTKRST